MPSPRHTCTATKAQRSRNVSQERASVNRAGGERGTITHRREMTAAASSRPATHRSNPCPCQQTSIQQARWGAHPGRLEKVTRAGRRLSVQEGKNCSGKPWLTPLAPPTMPRCTARGQSTWAPWQSGCLGTPQTCACSTCGARRRVIGIEGAVALHCVEGARGRDAGAFH
jgi:hypothetical protein